MNALSRTLATLAFALCACASDDVGIRRMPEPQRVSPDSARAASDKGDWNLAASSWYELYLRGGDDAPLACAEAARALCELGDFPGAQRLLESALKRTPDQIELLEALANVLIRSGFRRAAEPHLERVLELQPERISTLLLLARTRFELGLEAASIAPLERRIALGGGDAETWILLARARRGAGQYPQAVEAYAQAFRLGETSPDRLIYAASLYFEAAEGQRGGLDAGLAEEWLTRACELDPQSAAAQVLLGRLREEAGRMDEALVCYRRAVEADPGDRNALRRLAEFHKQRGERELALAVGQRLVDLEKGPERRAEAERWFAELSAVPAPPAPGRP